MHYMATTLLTIMLQFILEGDLPHYCIPIYSYNFKFLVTYLIQHGYDETALLSEAHGQVATSPLFSGPVEGHICVYTLVTAVNVGKDSSTNLPPVPC